MPARTRTEFPTLLATRFADNTEGDISAQDGRSLLQDIFDSLLLQGEVDARVVAGYDHILPGTNITIDRSAPGQITISASMGGPAGVTEEQARDIAGTLLGTLVEFDYHPRTNTLEFTLRDDSVTSRKIAAEAVTEGLIADEAVTGRKIPRNTIQSSHIAADQVGPTEIAGEAVGFPELDSDVLERIDGKLNVDDLAEGIARWASAGAATDLETAMEYLFANRFNLTDLPGFPTDAARSWNGQILEIRVSAEGTVTLVPVDKPAGGGGGDDAYDWATEGNTDPIPLAKMGEESGPRRTEDAKLAEQIADLRAHRGGTQMRVEPRFVPTIQGLVRNYTLHIDSLQGIPEDAVKVIVTAGRGGGISLAWDNAWVRTRREIPITRFTQATLTNALGNNLIHADDHSVPVQVGFYPATVADNSNQDASIALAYFVTSILIGDGLDLGEEFTGREKRKLAGYAENPRGNGASFIAPLVTLDQMTRVAYSSSVIASGNIAPGTFMIGVSGGNQGIFARFTDRDSDATAFLENGLNVEIDTGSGTLTSVTHGAQGWTARLSGDYSGVGVGDRVRFNLGPKAPRASGASLDQIEDFARKDRAVAVPADKTLPTLTGLTSVGFNFGGGSPQTPTPGGSTAQVEGRPAFGTATSDTAVVTETNVIAGSGFTLTNAEATHAGALILVDLAVQNIATDRFSDVELILQTSTGTAVATVELPHDPIYARRGLQFDLSGLSAGGSFRFALKATVRGREQTVIVTLSRLLYQQDGQPPLEPFVERVARREVDKLADIDNPRLTRIERDLLAGDLTLPPPTRTGFTSPQWASAGATHQRQLETQAFVIPASGYAQIIWTGEEAWASAIMHVDDWKIPHQQIGYQDSAGAILVVSDGTRVYLQNRNAAGTGAYPNASVLLLGRGYRWLTWPEAAPATGVVTVLSEAQIRALIPAPPAVVQTFTAANLAVAAAEVTLQTANITPRTNTTRVRIVAHADLLSQEATNARGQNATVDVRIYRGATMIREVRMGNTNIRNGGTAHEHAGIEWVDTPNSAAAQTYTLRAIRAGNLNWTASDRQLILEEVL